MIKCSVCGMAFIVFDQEDEHSLVCKGYLIEDDLEENIEDEPA